MDIEDHASRMPFETRICLVIGSILGATLAIANEALRALPAVQRDNVLEKFDTSFTNITCA